ncbi:MAG TPA: hypothetical protein VKH63_11360 [Candidatus Acidoferrum sp.]|nr:hypothetical protein [Candidatus Acidoferrum sp.]
MKTSRSLAVLGLLLVTACSSFGQVQHRGMSARQEFLLCAQKVLGKTVLWQEIFTGRLDTITVPKVACPMRRDEFIAALQKNEAISVFEDGRFAFLVQTGESPQRQPNFLYDYKFKKLPIHFQVSQRQSEGSRQLTKLELQGIADAILRDTRGVEVLWTIGNSPEADCMTTEEEIQMQLEVEARRLSKTGPESVIAALRASPCEDPANAPQMYFTNVARLIYGEIKDGIYEMKWDSPLLYAPSDWISYKDLNGDGFNEIAVWPPNGDEIKQWSDTNEYAYQGGAVAFDREGNELTRGKFCSQYMGYSEDRACPILAKKVEFAPASGGRLDIVTTGWVDDQWLRYKGATHWLHLIDGHYVPEPTPPIPTAPLHVEVLPAKDVGLLLGLRLGGGTAENYQDFMYGVYRTLWITRTGGNVKIEEAPSLLVPRRDGFWQAGSTLGSRGAKKVEFVWSVPLGQTVQPRALNEEAAKGIADGTVSAHPIEFISGDYIGVGKTEDGQLSALYTYKMDDHEFKEPVDISAVVGAAGAQAMDDKAEKPGDLVMGMPVSMQGSCQLEVPHINWVVARNEGHWVVEGWGSWGEQKCSDKLPAFQTSVRVPAKVGGFDELPVTWDQVVKAFPGATDAFGAPTSGLLIVIVGDEVMACGITKEGIGKPVARFSLLAGEKAVMAQWAVGKFVESWGEQFEIFKRNPGPHNEPPSN